MSLYKFLSDDCVMHVPTRRAIYLNQPLTIHLEAYLAWVAEGNTADQADSPHPPLPIPSRKSVILSELDAIDRKSIRSIREGDAARIAQWEAQAAALRAELAGL